MGVGGISLDVCLCGWVELVGAVLLRYISFLKSLRCLLGFTDIKKPNVLHHSS